MPSTAPIQLTERSTGDTLSCQGEIVLRYSCTLPQLHGLSPRAQRRVNRYYRRLEETLQHHCRIRLLAQASQTAVKAHKNALPFTPWEANLSWETTLCSDYLWSLCWCWQVTAGPASLMYLWQGDVWDLTTGLPCPLNRFAGTGKRRTRSRLRKLARQEKQPRPGRNCSFVLTEEGLRCRWPVTPHPAGPQDYFCLSLPLPPVWSRSF